MNSNNRFGYDQLLWTQAIEEMRSILIDRARAESPISYSDLARAATTIQLQARSPILDAMLGQISRSERDLGHGMLSVLVVRIDDMMPGNGFYELAGESGADVSDHHKVWVDEFKRVVSYWRDQP